MHLVVDARTIRPGATGVGHYVAGLLRGLDELLAGERARGGIQVTALRLSKSHSQHHGWKQFWTTIPNIEREDVDVDYEEHPYGDYWSQRYLPDLVADLGGDVLVSPAFTGVWGPRAVKRILIIPDTIAWEMRWAMPRRFRAYLRTATRLSAWGADRVLSISPTAARRLTRLGISGANPIGVVPCGVDTKLFSADERRTVLPDGRYKSRPLIVYTSSFEPRKNHAVLFEAMRRLRRVRPELVLVHHAREDELVRFSRLSRGIDISFIAPSSIADIAQWTRAADVSVFPSLMEGFGVPALEAMASGVPLVASDTDTMRWLTRSGECAALVNPRDSLAWAKAIESILVHPSQHAVRREAALRRASHFTWPRAAEKLLKYAAEVVR